MTTDHLRKFDDATLSRLVGESLGLLPRLNPDLRPVDVKEVRIHQSVIMVDFSAESTHAASVQTEIVNVMAGLSGLLATNELSDEPIHNYGVRAWGDEDWLAYAFSSAEAAKLIGGGRLVEWLATALYQDNTPEHRMHSAKRLISQVEVGMRDVIDRVLSKSAGPGWRSQTVSDLSGARSRASRAGVSSPSPRQLLDYAYLDDLRRIVAARWDDFAQIWDSRSGFEQRMERLNALRREESHNRSISTNALSELELLHDWILGAISRRHPDLVADYVRTAISLRN